MTEKFGYKNPMMVPKIDKIVMLIWALAKQKKIQSFLTQQWKDTEIISGQKAVLTRAKNSIANFKLREGMPIGL